TEPGDLSQYKFAEYARENYRDDSPLSHIRESLRRPLHMQTSEQNYESAMTMFHVIRRFMMDLPEPKHSEHTEEDNVFMRTLARNGDFGEGSTFKRKMESVRTPGWTSVPPLSNMSKPTTNIEKVRFICSFGIYCREMRGREEEGGRKREEGRGRKEGGGRKGEEGRGRKEGGGRKGEEGRGRKEGGGRKGEEGRGRKEEGRGRKEEGGGKRKEGRKRREGEEGRGGGKREEGRGRREEGGGRREERGGKREDGRGRREEGGGKRRREEGRGRREEGGGKREEGRGSREEGGGKREDRGRKREEGRVKREEGRVKREEGRGRYGTRGNKFLNFLRNFVREGPDGYSNYCQKKLRRTLAVGCRKLAPTTLELQAAKVEGKIMLPVTTMDALTYEYEVDSSTTCEQLLLEMKKKLGLKNSFGFSVFAKQFDQVFNWGCSTDIVMDVVSLCEQYAIHKNVPEEDKNNWSIFVRKDVFLSSHNAADDPVETNLIYSQIMGGIHVGEYRCSNDQELAELLAKRYFIEYGKKMEDGDLGKLIENGAPPDEHDTYQAHMGLAMVITQHFESVISTLTQADIVKQQIVNFGKSKKAWSKNFSRIFNANLVYGPKIPRGDVRVGFLDNNIVIIIINNNIVITIINNNIVIIIIIINNNIVIIIINNNIVIIIIINNNNIVIIINNNIVIIIIIINNNIVIIIINNNIVIIIIINNNNIVIIIINNNIVIIIIIINNNIVIIIINNNNNIVIIINNNNNNIVIIINNNNIVIIIKNNNIVIINNNNNIIDYHHHKQQHRHHHHHHQQQQQMNVINNNVNSLSTLPEYMKIKGGRFDTNSYLTIRTYEKSTYTLTSIGAKEMYRLGHALLKDYNKGGPNLYSP
ncbi:hypothetical protein QZH41_014595, partial [Actinostola sp. cb2023]